MSLGVKDQMQRVRQGEEEVASGGSKCQDCGNQAKKECSYLRCRTCCKNKGFHCQTHIKSTWTPVDHRRRHFQGQGGDHHIPQNQNQINPYSGLELRFPAATNSMATFRCIHVRSMDDAVNEIAYQTSVNIGGHVFSGLLYDQGPEYQRGHQGESSTGFVDKQQNNNNNNLDSSGASATHQEYPFPLSSFRPGMPYLTYPRS
ncbi:hypothetical protein AAZX31_06G008800 [Glycine max]|nr:hypothetical protein JHK85_014407 [Glycine max]KAG5147154.1 hypothetical protein JHK82_014035 [Glycine max]KAH1123606.1 hypothetical protein GYH30_013713 [Glycine max]KRH51478.2 hypothetical protein GLYMA_06G009200v4 [Glycine max]|eukprot:XP_006582461.1 protein SHI RELATED SEQUENCE 3 [Glycine max]